MKTINEVAIEIAMGTFLSSWEGNAIEVYNKLSNEANDDFDVIEYAVPWKPFENDRISDVWDYINLLVNQIIDNCSVKNN